MKRSNIVWSDKTLSAFLDDPGDLLDVDVTIMDGAERLTLTGQLGEVMKESAHAALSYIRSNVRALGVPHLSAYLNAASSLAESIENGKGDTRRYTKRQFTFARHQLRQFSWLEPETAFETILARLSQRNSVCSNESSICD